MFQERRASTILKHNTTKNAIPENLKISGLFTYVVPKYAAAKNFYGMRTTDAKKGPLNIFL